MTPTVGSSTRMRLSDREELGRWLGVICCRHSHPARLGSVKGDVETSRLIALACRCGVGAVFGIGISRESIGLAGLASIDFILNPPSLKAVTARHGVWRLLPYGRRRDSTGVHPTRYRRVIGIVITVERNHGCCTDAYSEQHREERGAQLASQTRRTRLFDFNLSLASRQSF